MSRKRIGQIPSTTRRLLLMNLPRAVTLNCAVVVLLSGCRPAVIPSKLTVDELAAAVGVSAWCAETNFHTPRYARLVVVTTDATGERREETADLTPARKFRLRILSIGETSGSSKQLRYFISAPGTGSSEGSIQVDPGTWSKRSTVNMGQTFLWEAVYETRSKQTTKIRIELESSSNPFSKDDSSR